MNQKADRLIAELTPAIEQKCDELRARRRARLEARGFALLCALVVIVPVLLTLVGVSLTLLIAPIGFMSLCVVVLLPALLGGRGGETGGNRYEQV